MTPRVPSGSIVVNGPRPSNRAVGFARRALSYGRTWTMVTVSYPRERRSIAACTVTPTLPPGDRGLMASRSEELRAYRFAMRRLLGAVVSQRADVAVPHARRTAGAIGAGAAIAVMSLGVVAAIGLIAPGAAEWRRSDAVIVEKETGARFVYLDGALHPVLNYTSARLIVGAADVPIVMATRADLAGARRGNVLGIPGAPDSLPAAGSILADAWSVCTDSAGSTTSVIASHTL